MVKWKIDDVSLLREESINSAQYILKNFSHSVLDGTFNENCKKIHKIIKSVLEADIMKDFNVNDLMIHF